MYIQLVNLFCVIFCRNGSVIIDFELIFRYEKPAETSTGPIYQESLSHEQNTEITEKLNTYLEEKNNTLVLENVVATLEEVISTSVANNSTDTTTTGLMSETTDTITTTATIEEQTSSSSTSSIILPNATSPVTSLTINTTSLTLENATTGINLNTTTTTTTTTSTTQTLDDTTTFSIFELPTHGSRFKTTSALLPATIFHLPSFQTTDISETTTPSATSTTTTPTLTLATQTVANNPTTTDFVSLHSTTTTTSNNTDSHGGSTSLSTVASNATAQETIQTTTSWVVVSTDNQTTNASATEHVANQTTQFLPTNNTTGGSTTLQPSTSSVENPENDSSTLDPVNIPVFTTDQPITDEPENTQGTTKPADTTLASISTTTTPVTTTDSAEGPYTFLPPLTAIIDWRTSESWWTTLPDDSEESTLVPTQMTSNLTAATDPIAETSTANPSLSSHVTEPGTQATATAPNTTETSLEMTTALTTMVTTLPIHTTQPTTTAGNSHISFPFWPIPDKKTTLKRVPYTLVPILRDSTPGTFVETSSIEGNSSEEVEWVPTPTTPPTSTADLNDNQPPSTLPAPSFNSSTTTGARNVRSSGATVAGSIGSTTTDSTVAVTANNVRSQVTPMLMTDKAVSLLPPTSTAFLDTASEGSPSSTPVSNSECEVLGYSQSDCRQLVLGCPGDGLRHTHFCPQGLAYSVSKFAVQSDISACTIREKIPVPLFASTSCRPRNRAAYLNVHCNPYNGTGVGDLVVHRVQRCCGRYEAFHTQSQRCHRVGRPPSSNDDNDDDLPPLENAQEDDVSEEVMEEDEEEDDNSEILD